MAEIHDQLASEGIVKEGQAASMRGPFGASGRLYLTGRRLVFLKMNPLFMAFGAIGAALGVATKPKKVQFDIPLSEIGEVAKEKAGLARSILAVSRSGGEVAKFGVKDFEGWADAVRSAKDAQATGA
jgi:hypothetical protein